MLAYIRRYPTVSFFVLAYGISWALWAPLLLTGARVAPGSTTTHFPGLLGPALAAVIVQFVLHGTRGLRKLWTRMTLVSRPASRFWAYALSPVWFLAFAFAILFLRSMPLPGVAEFSRYSGLPQLSLPLVVILAIIFSGYGEELGWRGFALERLQARFGPLTGSLVLAALWAGWHLPAFAFVQTYRDMTAPMIVGGFLLGLTCGSIVLSRVSHQTGGSVLAAALWHATYNLTSATSAGNGLVSAITTMCVMVWAFILVVREWKRPRARSLLSAMIVPHPA